jgi:hypothetical protein
VFDPLLYAALVFLSLCNCYVGCMAEVVTSNIRHIENGRTPNAGCSIFPGALVLPVVFVLAALGLNHLLQHLGYTIVGAFGLAMASADYRTYRKNYPKLRRLLAQTPSVT